MTVDEKEINRKLRILNHANQSGNIAKTCRYFGIPRSLFYVWRNTYRKCGDEGSVSVQIAAPSAAILKHPCSSLQFF